jgi:hypothetical protein
VLSGFKEREARYINIRRKLENRPEGAGLLTPRQAAMLSQTSSPSGTRGGSSSAGRPVGRRQSGVLRPGAATRPAAAADEDDVDDDADDEAETSPAPKAKGGSTRSNGAGRAPVGSAASPRRPPPRPRKGKGAKKGGKRR